MELYDLKSSIGSLKLVFEYVGYANQTKTITVTANSLNIVLNKPFLKWMR
jgi:hypothetical protein